MTDVTKSEKSIKNQSIRQTLEMCQDFFNVSRFLILCLSIVFVTSVNIDKGFILTPKHHFKMVTQFKINLKLNVANTIFIQAINSPKKIFKIYCFLK